MRRRQTILIAVILTLALIAGIVYGVTVSERREAPSVESAMPSVPMPEPSATPEPESSAAPSALPAETAAPTAEATQTPTPTPEPEPTPTPTPEAQTCTLTIVCHTALRSDALPENVRAVLPESGVILGTVTAELQAGDTVWSVLQRECRARGVALEANFTPAYNTAYVQGIGQLYEFDCGQGSGWIFKVNGTAPGVGCSSYTLQPGDNILWTYTCDYGYDV